MIFALERRARSLELGPVAGADEAGRGACAGPIVGAAVMWPATDGRSIPGLRDSKLLDAGERERLYERVVERALAWAVVSIPAPECDRVGVHQANLEVLRRALVRLWPRPQLALVDGFGVPGLPFPGVGVWKGDVVSGSVAAASIVAKVTRDRMMQQLDAEYPDYGFAVHKGYSTRLHQDRLELHGPCAAHRMSYRNVQRAGRVRAS